jgi:hypothetical protein
MRVRTLRTEDTVGVGIIEDALGRISLQMASALEIGKVLSQ